LEQRLRPHLKPTNKSWRVDETYVRVKGRWCYLYRAIDSKGATIDFLLSTFHGRRRCQAPVSQGARRSIPSPTSSDHTDLAPIYGSAIPDCKKEGTLRNCCRCRPVQYLNNILEQDHRAIKRRVNAKQGFREFPVGSANDSSLRSSPHDPQGASSIVAGNDLLRQIQFIDSLFDLAA
jgi:transposase-like protein